MEEEKEEKKKRKYKEMKDNLLLRALKYRDLNLVRCLLDEGAEVFIDPGGEALGHHDPVGYKLRRGRDEELLREAVINNDIELCEILMKIGANFNYKLEKKERKVRGTSRLRGIVYKWDKTGIYYGLFSYVNTPEMIELLLKYGVEITQEDINTNEFLKEYLEREKAYQQLSSARLPIDYEVSKKIGEHLSRMKYNPDVTRRISEERQHKEMADYLDSLKQYGGKKKRRKTKKKKKNNR